MKNRNWLLAGLGIAGYYAAKTIYEKIQEASYHFENKVVIITGGTRGLGLILARKLADEGAKLVICARNEEDLAEAELELRQRGAKVLAIPCDVTNKEEVDKLVKETINQFHRVDILINNAGEIIGGPFQNDSIHDFDRLMKLYFYGPLYTISAVLPFMKNVGDGRIVNISSIGGKFSFPHLLPYNTGKFALTGLSEGLYAELKKDGIKVTTICPGLMRTGSPRNVEVKGQFEKEYAWFKVSDSIPGMSVSAEGAADKILKACKRGDAELIISLPAKLAVALHGLFPGLMIRSAQLINRILPEPTDSDERVKAYETDFEKKRTPITKLTDRAAAKNNEI